MALVIDPAENEVRELARVTEWREKQVLEIGCGNGRLTRRLARLGPRILAIDPDRSSIREARRNLPKRLVARVRYRTGDVQKLSFPDESFDLAVFSWSL